MTQDALGKKRGIADIVILVDASGSMASCLEALKNNIGVLVDTMVNPGASTEPTVKDWRIKVCGYRDAMADGGAWWEENPFTTDVSQVRADLSRLEAKGGGDEPESLLDALWKLAKMPSVPNAGDFADANSWRHRHDAARCVIVFTDASCHMVTSIPEAGGATFDDVDREISSNKLRISLFCPEADCYHAFSEIDKIEVEFVGTLSDAQEKMAEFTRDTEAFRRTMQQIAKSISVSSDTPLL